MLIQLTIDVKGLRTEKDASDFANNLSEHIKGTFNDDSSLGEIYWKRLPAKKSKKGT